MGEKDGGRLILENLPRSHHRILFVKPPDLSLQLPKVSLQNQYGFLGILFIKVPDPLQDSLYKASRSFRPATTEQSPRPIRFLKDSLHKASRSTDPGSRSQPPESMHFLKDSIHRAFLKDSLYKASRSEDPASRSQPPESPAQSGRVQFAPLPLYHSPTLYVEFSL